MSKKATELEAGALNAWTPLQQAALYHRFLAKQAEEDDKAALKEYEDAEKKKKRGDSGDIKPDKIEAGKIIDELMKSRCAPLYNFLDCFASPHIALAPFVLLHCAYWWSTPWYLHFILPYPILYLVPLYNTVHSFNTGKDRPLWQAWWVILASVEYLEILLFRDNARSLIWWPKLKALCFVLLYSVLYHEEKPDARGRKSKAPVIGALKVIELFLPKIEKTKGDDKDDKGKDKDKEGDKIKEKQKEKEKEKSQSKSSSEKGKERDKEKAKAEAKAKEKGKSSNEKK